MLIINKVICSKLEFRKSRSKSEATVLRQMKFPSQSSFKRVHVVARFLKNTSYYCQGSYFPEEWSVTAQEVFLDGRKDKVIWASNSLNQVWS